MFSAMRFQQCCRINQTYTCFKEDRWHFNHGFNANFVLHSHFQPANHSQNKAHTLTQNADVANRCKDDNPTKNQPSNKVRSLTYHIVSTDVDSVMNITIKDINCMHAFFQSIPVVIIHVQDLITPTYMVLACVKAQQPLRSVGHFHQQFILKLCYRFSNLMVLLQTYGHDSRRMKTVITINNIEIKLHQTTSEYGAHEYLMGTNNCIEHYSHFRHFKRLFINKHGTCTQNIQFDCAFHWPWKKFHSQTNDKHNKVDNTAFLNTKLIKR